MGSEKKWVFSCWEARSFRDNQSSQAVDPGRCPLAHCRQKRLRFHGRDGGLPTHGVSCRANARCLMWTRFDGWFIQGGPLPHQFIQWSYGAPFFSRVKQNRYPIDFRPKTDTQYIIELLSPFITVV